MCGPGFGELISVLPCNSCHSRVMGSSCTKPDATLYPSGFQARENWRVAICQSREDNKLPSLHSCRGGCRGQDVSLPKVGEDIHHNHQCHRFSKCSRVSPCDVTQLYVNRVSNQDAWLTAPSYSQHICKCCDQKSLGSSVSLPRVSDPRILFNSCSDLTHFKSDLENRNLDLKNFVVTRHFTCEEKERSVIFKSTRSLQSKNNDDNYNTNSNKNNNNFDNCNSNNNNNSNTNSHSNKFTIFNKREHQRASFEEGVLRLSLPCRSYESREIILKKNFVREIEGSDNRQGINQLFLRNYLM
ncbi:UNVERIFIED_CONTAM: hypothetical protein RMT77_018458 [Armadillidium vulgare]